MKEEIIQLENIKRRLLNISTVEWVIVLLLFVLGCCVGFHFASGPKYWDDLAYIHIAWNMDVVVGFENRYSTIFLLPIFTFLAKGDPLVGSKYYGVFSFMIILLLIYINTRLISRSNKILLGVLSVILMLSYTSFVKDLGVVLADYTVTMMMLFGIFIYLLYLLKHFQQNSLLMIFGLVLFFSFKSKETGLLLSLLIPGFFPGFRGKTNKLNGVKIIGFISIGILLGILFFILLNGLFLKDAFYGFRPTNIENYTAMFSYNALKGQLPTINYFEYIVTNCVFIFSLVYFLKSDSLSVKKTKWIYLLAIGIIAFLDLTLAHGEIDTVYPRYLTPAIAIFSILAPQCLSGDTSISASSKIKTNSYATIGGLLIGTFFTFILYFITERYFLWTFEYLLSVIIIPLVSCILLLWGVFMRRTSFFSLLIVAALIGTIALPNAIQNLFQLTSTKSQQESRFSPFTPFKEVINCDENMVLISKSLYQANDLFARDLQSSMWMYNVFFGCHKTEANFQYAENQTDLLNDLSSNDYDYVFLLTSDIDFISNQQNFHENIFSKYLITSDEKNLYFLMSLAKND